MDTFDARHASFMSWPHGGRLSPIHMAAAGFYQHAPGRDAVSCFNCKISMEDWDEHSDPTTEHQSASPNCTWNNGTYMTTVDERLGSFHSWPIDIKPLPIALASAGFYHSNKTTDSVTCFCCKLALRDWKKDDDPIEMHLQHAPFGRPCSWIRKIISQPDPYVPPPLPVSAVAGIPRKCEPCNRTFQSGNKFHKHRKQMHCNIGRKIGITVKRPGAIYLGKYRVTKPVALSQRQRRERTRTRILFGRDCP